MLSQRLQDRLAGSGPTSASSATAAVAPPPAGQAAESGGTAVSASAAAGDAAQLCRDSLPGQDLLAWASGTVAQFRQYQYGGPTPIRPLAAAFPGLPVDTGGAWCAVKIGAETTRWLAVVPGWTPQRLLDMTGPGGARGAVHGPYQVP